jgi:hypothetical protein
MRVESRILYPKVVAFEAEMLNRRLTRNAAG